MVRASNHGACIIGTRGSSLAMCQAQIIQTKLEERFPGQRFELKPIKAQADQHPDVSLTAMSGEGIFVKELESALIEGAIDLAVHSLKDLPLDAPRELAIAAVLERNEPRDAFVSRSGHAFDQIPKESRIGTSSVRRRSQLLRLRSDLELLEIRGNVDTRLRKLDEGRYDAIVLAACGLIRLGLEHRITEYLDIEQMVPEPGQGALAVEVRADDAAMREMVSALEDPISRACTDAERAFLRALGGGCRVPIAAYADQKDGTLELQGTVVAADGSVQVRGTMTGSMTEPVSLGERLAKQLESQGAIELLKV